MENAYSLHVLMTAIPGPTNGWMGFTTSCHLPRREASCYFTSANRQAYFQTAPFDVIRFGISQDALEEIANCNGFSQTEELRLQMSGGHDAVLHGLAQALAPAIERPEQISTLFIDHIATAFFYSCHECIRSRFGQRRSSTLWPRALAASPGQGSDVRKHRG